MLEKLYKRTAVIERHQAAPRLADREQFLAHLAEQGYGYRMLRKTSWLLLIIVSSMPSGDQMVSMDEIRCHARLDQVPMKSRPSTSSGERSEHTRRILERVAIAWFSYLGQLSSPARENTPSDHYVNAYEQFMREERGLSEVTIATRCQRVNNCLQSLLRVEPTLEQITTQQIDYCLHQHSEKGWCRSSLGALASDLRGFFLYAESQSWCRAGLSDLIESPRLYRDERLPNSIGWSDVEALIESLSGDDAATIRDRAIILLLAFYGLRRGEVARLKLEDIDWKGETFQITRTKQRRFQCYPLIQSVGNALIRYLSEVRPRCAHREVFLTMKAPWRPLSAQSITPLVRWRSAAVCEGAVVYSPHRLRHACAQHLLAEGFSLKQIGDQLGHRSATSTAIYAKIDLTRLRQVAEIDLGRLL